MSKFIRDAVAVRLRATFERLMRPTKQLPKVETAAILPPAQAMAPTRRHLRLVHDGIVGLESQD